MQGLLFLDIRNWDEDLPGYTGENHYCVEGKTGKIHVKEDFYGNNDPVVELVGPCDGSCGTMVDVSAAIEALVNGKKLSVSVPQDDSSEEEVIEQPFVEKLISKVNRWRHKRHRGHQRLRIVTDFS